MSAGSASPSAFTRAFHWTFDSRVNGRVTIAQTPNVWVYIFLAAVVVEIIAHPTGLAGRVVTIVRGASLAVWSLDEIMRGVNPWRRCLGCVGCAVIAYEIVV